MIPIRDALVGRTGAPLVTYALIALNCAIYFWDREWRLDGPNVVFGDLAMRPNEVLAVFSGGDPFPLVTLFTSLFLHGSLLHLLGNMLYLLTFGIGVEAALGGPRFALYYLFWGVAASAAHIFVDPTSDIPTVGASGAIGGALGCYFLLFPGNKIEFLVPFIPLPFVVSAWVLLGSWFLFQIFFRQEGVANWAHAGGFLAGMLTVLIMGGREKVLRDKNLEWDDDFD
jgi:membrane associated rhomboid family serine protease